MVLSSLGLPPGPDEHLDERAELLDATFREVTAGLPDNTAVRFDEHGRLHLAALPAEAEPQTRRSPRSPAAKPAWPTCTSASPHCW